METYTFLNTFPDGVQHLYIIYTLYIHRKLKVDAHGDIPGAQNQRTGGPFSKGKASPDTPRHEDPEGGPCLRHPALQGGELHLFPHDQDPEHLHEAGDSEFREEGAHKDRGPHR